MKKYFGCLLLTGAFFTNAFSQSPSIASWLSGDNSINKYGIYGTKGVDSWSNKPGSRYGAVTWTDYEGNLWLMGGNGYAAGSTGYLNDLWKLYTSTGIHVWTWIGGDKTPGQMGDYGTKGVAAAANKPGARENAVSWKDAEGNFWLMGGYGKASGSTGYLNDLWKFDPSGNKWTWVSGDNTPNKYGVYGTKGYTSPDNKPGARAMAVSWTDEEGNLWLMGGYGYASGSTGQLNDVWKYDPYNNRWSWISGDNTPNSQGVYGTKGVAAAANKPGAREDAVSWTDDAGNFWLMGGNGKAGGTTGYLNDLWKFNTGNEEWTWVNGDNTPNKPGIYGIKGYADAANKPGSRSKAVSWLDESGNLCLMGGYGYAGSGTGRLNDLWKYHPGTNQWIWQGGDNSPNKTGIYGNKDEYSGTNKPGAREDAVYWNSYLLGGIGYATGGTPGKLNDLWFYKGPEYCYDNTVSGVKAESITGTSAKLSWDAAINAFSYKVQWKPSSGATWTTVPDIAGTSYNLTGLEPGTTYTFRVQITCGYLGVYSAERSFTTPLPATWVSGDNTLNKPGIYGTKGVPAANNKPGARDQAVSWTDAAGNLWLMGGRVGVKSDFQEKYSNDLWKFTPSTQFWTWVSGDSITETQDAVYGTYGTRGVAAADNQPGSRKQAVSWTDAAGNLWLMGGYGYAQSSSGDLNDLWKFNPSTQFWTWVGGDSTANKPGTYGTKGVAVADNKPGGRRGGVSWTDVTGNLWLMGGFGYATGNSKNYLNDLWKFNPSTGLWTWVSGDNIPDLPGIYGIKGVPAGNNKPGARSYAISWTDAAGNFWLMGGSNSGDFFNDLWMFAPNTGFWVWISGDNSKNQPGVYGSKGLAAEGNKPGARDGAVSWTDDAGDLWLMGGNYFNDLWKFSLSTGLWTWVSGDNTAGQYGIYGTKGVPSETNKPGARENAVSWKDAAGNLWLMGGNGLPDGNDYIGFLLMNDLWKYGTSTNYKTTYYRDADGDGYGNPVVTVKAVTVPAGYVTDNTDCDDTKASVHPGAPEANNGIDDDCDGQTDETITFYRDFDNDGYGNDNVTAAGYTPPAGYIARGGDCNDSKNTVYPGAPEICDNLDNNCNGQIDEGVTPGTFYRDYDRDGYGNSNSTTQACTAPAGYVARGGDCNDTKNTVYPGAPEVCDNLDNDCDGLTDEGFPQVTFYKDYDRDGYGNSSAAIQACTAPLGYVSTAGDCNDSKNTIYPGAPEICDNLDNDCDGIKDEGLPQTTFYKDYDKDGYGAGNTTVQACAAPAGYVARDGDCNDSKNTVYPGAPEICDNLDNNCNGQIDEGFTLTTFYRDYDRDLYGSNTVTMQACVAPAGYVAISGDCDDARSTVNPGAAEVVNGIDDNCNGVIDETPATVTAESTEIKEAVRFSATAAPNPSAGRFTIRIQSAWEGAVRISIFDMLGNLIEKRNAVSGNTTLQVGAHYRPGTYIAEVVQGTERRIVKLIKQQ